jgi:hypothetical protein
MDISLQARQCTVSGKSGVVGRHGHPERRTSDHDVGHKRMLAAARMTLRLRPVIVVVPVCPSRASPCDTSRTDGTFVPSSVKIEARR